MKRSARDSKSGGIRNLGPVSLKWLAAVGIHTLADLREVGVINAYNLVRAHGYKASLNLVWAMQGAVMDVHWTKIPAAIKHDPQQRLASSHDL